MSKSMTLKRHRMVKPKNCFTGLILFLLVLSCSGVNNNADVTEKSSGISNENTDPLFANSIVSTNIDFITENDEDSFVNITYLGQYDKEMPDSRNDMLFDTNTYVFQANFSLGTSVEIWAHSDFESEATAKSFVDKLAGPLGKLPTLMRNKLSHVVLHKGDAGAFAEAEANFFVVYSDNIDLRISNNDFEETVFHESVHASLDSDYLNSTEWLSAQQNDKTFITQYAKENSDKEDLAESALFVYTILKHPGRLSSNTENWVKQHIPNRLKFIVALFE
ncbi:hypothetical protein ACFQZJ_03725 [Maribacter chungangensis]|uniref:Uncharacterized protein n=1 Tax=Maribacter chungangensis TaxID=1069117 RepID=A0ABW3AZQ6_9FLAO